MNLHVTRNSNLKIYEYSIPTFSIAFQEEGASCMELTMYKTLDLELGDVVAVMHDEALLWQGIVWELSDDGMKAVDLLVYLKNPDINTYEEITLNELVRNACDTCRVRIGQLDTSDYKHPVIELDGAELMTVVYEAITDTRVATGESYHLLGHLGKVDLANMRRLIYRYTGPMSKPRKSKSLDDTYNQVMVKSSGESSSIEVRQSLESIQRFGLLRKLESDDGDLAWLADNLLKLSNTVKESVSITLYHCIGQEKLVPGYLLELQNEKYGLSGVYQIKGVTHTFSEGKVISELELYERTVDLDELIKRYSGNM